MGKEQKYRLDTRENRAFLKELREELLNFGRRFPSLGGSSYYLGDDGTPWTERPRETWITSRMTHVYSIGQILGYEDCRELARVGLRGWPENCGIRKTEAGMRALAQTGRRFLPSNATPTPLSFWRHLPPCWPAARAPGSFWRTPASSMTRNSGTKRKGCPAIPGIRNLPCWTIIGG